MNKKSTFCIIGITFKLLVYFLLFSVLAVSNFIVADITPFWRYLYGVISFICFGAFGLSFFAKYRKPAYVLSGVTLTIFVLMSNYVPEIKEQRDIDICLDGGMIYDPIQKICRDDCWTWDKELGCLKEENLPDEKK